VACCSRHAGTTRGAGEPLALYNRKRDFSVTSEPSGLRRKGMNHSAATRAFVIQKHWASRLHYDFRLELDGVLVSWAVPKGPSYDPAKKQTAIHVEDHPVSYGSFEGTIPAKQYGAGTVIVWDRGTWQPVGDPREGLEKGKLVFHLHGEKLAGLWELVRISKPGDRQDEWILFKKNDAWARTSEEYDVIAALPDSVVAKPLGLVEVREPRGGAVGATSARPSTLDLSGAKKAPLPARLEPQLATLATSPPAGDWIVETKFDGYRVMARVERGSARLITRGGHDWTSKMKPLAEAIDALGIDSGWLDGEIVVMNASGMPDFNALQNAMDKSTDAGIQYFVFDAPFFGGMDLRAVPLEARRALLQRLFDEKKSDKVHFSAAFPAAPAQMLEAACKLRLEGIILKRPDAPYVSARTETWLKLKCAHRQEFVVIGFTDRSGTKSEVGSLLLGYHHDGVLRYSGSVGTGWDSAHGRDLHRKLVAIETGEAAVEVASVKPGRWSRRTAGAERWVTPTLVAEVSFTEWTPDGHVRHPVFKGLRSDKPATAITRERTAIPEASAAGAEAPIRKSKPSAKPTASVKVTNSERVIDPSTGLTKLALVRYYESVAEWMLPHLKGRPVSLVRAPEGITKELFFQKHPETRMPGLTELDQELWPGHSALLGVDSASALAAAAQMNTVEFHTWNSTIKAIDQPDRVIFDLDPGEGTTWPHVQEAALLTQAMLSELGLQSWLKTSGGKGLHVVVPLRPKHDYVVVKGFSQAVVEHMARTIPQRFVAKSGGSNRVGKIFIDYLRNGHAQTTAAAFSARSRPGLGVSMPIGWDQLSALKGGAQWSIATAREYLSFQNVDPWANYWKSKQSLDGAAKKLGYSWPSPSARRKASGKP
jgi:bifunctional non-homologous end joining protein LigD